jgi:hypothetical protein
MTTMPQNIDKIEQLLATGNIDQFSPGEKVQYINRICESLGLNPLTRPFEYVRFQGKTVLYARKDCTDQLRKIHGVSIRVTKQEIIEGVLFVTVEATDRTGRVDSDVGALPITGLKGEAMANATMKCVTKAKRRVTLSICGLGILDEAEMDTMPGAHVDQSAYSAEPPTDSTLADLREALMIKGRTEAQLLSYISGQFNGAKVERLEDMNSAQVEYARRILAGKPKEQA